MAGTRAGLIVVSSAAGQRSLHAKRTGGATVVFDWQSGTADYGGWDPSASDTNAYRAQSDLGGQPGLWLWPTGGKKAYSNGDYGEWSFAANEQASWTIYKNCHQSGGASSRRGVGPGYIARVDDGAQIGDPSIAPLVDDYRVRDASKDAAPWNVGNLGAANGGLGTFEVQAIRGTPGSVVGQTYDPVTSAKLTANGTHSDDRIISERMCADAQNGYGVYDVTLHSPVFVPSQFSIRYQMEVWLEDPGSHGAGSPDNAGLFRIQHLYDFTLNQVRSIVNVTVYGSAGDAPGSRLMLKEPKISATLRADGRYTEMDVRSLNHEQHVTRGQPEARGANLATRQTDDRTRYHVRWQCTGSGCPLNGSRADPCALPCFDVTMRARLTPARSIGDPFFAGTTLWENLPGSKRVGLDGWARDEAGAASAYPRDTGDDVAAVPGDPLPEHVNGVSNCSAGSPVKYGLPYMTPERAAYLSRLSEHANTGLESVRRWEELGWKDGVSGGGDHPEAYYDGSAVLFNAWEGGNGPSDCEPLMVVAPQTTKTYSVAAIFETSLEFL